MEEGLISKSKPKVLEVESNEQNSDFEWDDKSDGKPVHVDTDEKVTKGHQPKLALLPNRSEKDEMTNNSETGYGDGKFSLGRSNGIILPPVRLASVPRL